MKKRLEERIRNGNFRQLKSIEEGIDFVSNDYLGLAHSSLLYQMVCDECEKQGFYSLGSTGSRLLSGNHPYAEELESRLAAFHGYESGLLFSCGYLANIGLISSLGTEKDLILYDINVHASCHDGMSLSKAGCYPWRHNDVDHLEKRLKNISCNGNVFVCVESIYSTDGSIAPIEAIAEVCERYGALLIVDEAHAVGFFGEGGQGLVHEKNLTKRVFAQVTTFGKAVGAYGAIVLGSALLRHYLINFARSFIYTTALPMHNLAAIKCSYDLFPTMHLERKHLVDLIRMMGFSQTPIQPVVIPGNERVKALACHLQEKGWHVRPLLNPTVAKGSECLRICLHAFNTKNQIRDFYDEINSCWNWNRCGKDDRVGYFDTGLGMRLLETHSDR